jgi:hypothetical protein
MKKHKKTKPKEAKPLHEPVANAAGIDLGATEAGKSTHLGLTYLQLFQQ